MSATGTSLKSGRQFRRSKRLGLSFPVHVYGTNSSGDPFQERTAAISVSAHGALLTLGANVQKGQTILVENSGTRKQKEFRVVYIGSTRQGKRRVGIEFVNGPADFWGIYFPEVRADD
ncbi:MAG: PilZ domain-containing protein [Candidatus Acidiferrales bacterium]